jgi:hypothetical protein
MQESFRIKKFDFNTLTGRSVLVVRPPDAKAAVTLEKVFPKVYYTVNQTYDSDIPHDFLILFATTKQDYGNVYNTYKNVLPTFNVFMNVIEQCTKDKLCMVLRKRLTAEDSLFWYTF